MPKEAERKVKRQGGTARYRTIKSGDKLFTCAVTRKEGPRGGRTVCWPREGLLASALVDRLLEIRMRDGEPRKESPEGQARAIMAAHDIHGVAEAFEYAFDDRSHGDDYFAEAARQVAEEAFGMIDKIHGGEEEAVGYLVKVIARSNELRRAEGNESLHEGLQWVRVPAVMTGGKPYFWVADDPGKSRRYSWAVVWNRIAKSWVVKYEDEELGRASDPEEGKRMAEQEFARRPPDRVTRVIGFPAECAARRMVDALLEGDEWVRFTKRTNDPKLKWLEGELAKRGIKSRRAGESWHAPILQVMRKDLDAAWKILTPVDDVPDDDPRFGV
jgi:hypothetical protein